MILFTYFINVFLVKISINIHTSNITTYYPEKDTLAGIVDKEATNTLSIIRYRMKGYKKFFSCDRVNKGMHHIVKVTL